MLLVAEIYNDKSNTIIGGKVIFEGVGANDSFKINSITHHISGKKLQ